MKVYFGPAGIPISSEKRDTISGLKKVKELGLEAMEIEFVRNIYLNEKSAKEVKKVNDELGIKLSVHAPYFINLLSDKKSVVEKSKKLIIKSLKIAEILNAEFVVVHAAYYGKLEKEDAFEKMKKITLEILKKVKLKKTKLAYETMAKESQFADFETLLKLYDEINREDFSICIDFAHIFVRNGGKIDYKYIFDELEKRNINKIHSHFSNVKFNLKAKKFIDVHVPINSHPDFIQLAKEIKKRDVEITIISESPILEKDAMKMKNIFFSI